MKSSASSFQILQKAYNLLRKGEYGNGATLLERLIASGVEDVYVYFLLAVAYLYENQFYKADRIIGKISIVDSDYMPFIQLQAFLTLKSSSGFDGALKLYNELNEKYPADPYLVRGRGMVMTSIDFESFQKNCRLTDFVDVPKPGRVEKKQLQRSIKNIAIQPEIEKPVEKNRKGLRRFIIAAVVVIIFSFAVVSILKSGILDNLFKSETAESENFKVIDQVAISGYDYELLTKKKSENIDVFYYTANKVSEDFNSAKMLLKSGKLNEGLEILNKIFHSNVNFTVKEKTDFLIKWAIDVENRNFQEISYSDVAKKPYLFRGYSFKWRGKVANLSRRNDSVSFTLLVDYKDKDIFSGTADVFVGRPVGTLQNGSLVSIDSVLTNVVGGQRRIYLVARAIRILKNE